MRWSRCLVYLDDVISFGTTAPEALQRLGGGAGAIEYVWVANYGQKVYFYADRSGISGTHCWLSLRPREGVGGSRLTCT